MKGSHRKSFFYSVFITFLLANCLFIQPVSAQDSQPPWMKTLSCADSKYEGIVYCQASISNRNKTTSAVHVMAVNLKTPGIRFEYVLPSGVNGKGELGTCQDVNRTAKGKVGCDDPNNSAYYPLIPFDEAATRFDHTAIVVTADYGAGDQDEPSTREHGPEGLTIVQGNRLDGPLMNDKDNGAVGRPWLEISESPDLNVKIGQLTTDNGLKPDQWAYTALGGAPWMILNGNVTEGEITNCNGAKGSCYSKASQVAVGITADNTWLFLVVMEQPQPNLEAPPTPLLDLAYFMKEKLGVYKAIKLDGGGSTKLRYGGEDLYIDSGRRLSQYLVVTAKPITPPVQQPDVDLNAGTSLAGMVIDGFGMGSSTHLRVGIDQLDNYLAQQQEIGVQWVREEFPWAEIEPTAGQFRWHYGFAQQPRDFQAMLDKATSRQIKVMAMLGYGPIYLQTPDEEQLLARWKDYVQAVVNQYGKQIDYWEIGNEMDSTFFWGKVVKPGSDQTVPPNPSLYAKMLSSAYDIIKAQDKRDTVILGGLVAVTDRDCATNPYAFLKGVHDAGAWGKFDAIAFHPYWGANPPEQPNSRGQAHNYSTGACLSGERTDTLINEVRRLRYLANQFGKKPIWITELGWDQSWLQQISSYRKAAPDQIEADYLARTYVPLLSEPGVEKVFWYTLVGDTQSEDFKLGAPGQRVYHNLAELLTGSQPLGQFQGKEDQNRPGDDDVYEYRFMKGSQTIIVIWKARGGEEKRDVVIGDLSWDTLRLYTADAESLSVEAGEAQTVKDGALTISLNEHPMILVAQSTNWWDGLKDWWNNWSRDPFAGLKKWWDGWTGSLITGIQEWWQRQVQNAQVAFEQWLEEQERKLLELWEKQINEWLAQCCGSAAIPVGVTSLMVYQKRKRNIKGS